MARAHAGRRRAHVSSDLQRRLLGQAGRLTRVGPIYRHVHVARRRARPGNRTSGAANEASASAGSTLRPRSVVTGPSRESAPRSATACAARARRRGSRTLDGRGTAPVEPRRSSRPACRTRTARRSCPGREPDRAAERRHRRDDVRARADEERRRRRHERHYPRRPSPGCRRSAISARSRRRGSSRCGRQSSSARPSPGRRR